jgi:hypothetical protein
MEFHIADTFTDSLARLTGDEQKACHAASAIFRSRATGTNRSSRRLVRIEIGPHQWVRADENTPQALFINPSTSRL